VRLQQQRRPILHVLHQCLGPAGLRVLPYGACPVSRHGRRSLAPHPSLAASGPSLGAACAAGTYGPARCQTACTACPAGTYSAASARSCTPCPAGTYSTGGMGSCTPCPTGTTSGPGASACTPCPAGTYLTGGDCLPCPANTYSTGSATACLRTSLELVIFAPRPPHGVGAQAADQVHELRGAASLAPQRVRLTRSRWARGHPAVSARPATPARRQTLARVRAARKTSECTIGCPLTQLRAASLRMFACFRLQRAPSARSRPTPGTARACHAQKAR